MLSTLGQLQLLPPAVSPATVDRVAVRPLTAHACAISCSGSAKKFAQRPCLGFRRIVNGKAQPYEFMTYHEVGTLEQGRTRGSSLCQCAALLCQQLVYPACGLNQLAQPSSSLPSHQCKALASPRPGALSPSLPQPQHLVWRHCITHGHTWPRSATSMKQLSTTITLLAAGGRQGGRSGLRLRGPGPQGRRQGGHLRRQLPRVDDGHAGESCAGACRNHVDVVRPWSDAGHACCMLVHHLQHNAWHLSAPPPYHTRG